MEFCELNCVYAEWPEEGSLDGSGSCRTFQAIHCRKKARHVHKNMPCPEKKKMKIHHEATKTQRRDLED